MLSPKESGRKSMEAGRKSLDVGRKSLERDRGQLEQRISTEKLPNDIDSLSMVLLGHPTVGKSSIIAAVCGIMFFEK